MPNHSRTPAHPLRAVPDSRLPQPIVALLSGVLLVVIGLCAVAHGQSAEPDRTAPAAATAPARPAVTGDVMPHGPHRHHGNEHCALDGAARTTAQPAQHPPADTGATLPAGVFGALGALPAHRRPYRFRTRHTGRSALARTARWRI
ncbi:hypothetical protein [Streptomyces griseoruber]|uniref:Uncharacterized protein n=1 Tax=Streptomyces griseoruber TaxID=1943 RepID=A0A101T602_9ACTN|nr:hypothetical protein [Streptomyces griseoruber]KUN86394.1 hypothetical protein AQJ64_10270 [Streptomyces griseoruber]